MKKSKKNVDLSTTKEEQVPGFEKKFAISTLIEQINQTGLIYNNDLITRFVVSLLTKPFLILSGLSGSGKTQLALLFAKWICESESQFKLISVGSDWTNREPLLGYVNALDPTVYICPENNAIELILEANENPYKPYFLILDEMNLSYVERYFADFLSAMESHEPIRLHADKEGKKVSGNEIKRKIPASVILPRNLFIIGTVNVDETTYMFSPKVLDRAHVIEFKVTEEEMLTYLEQETRVTKEKINYQGCNMASHFTLLAKQPVNRQRISKETNGILIKFFKSLKSVGADFGYRTASEILRFYILSRELYPTWSEEITIDFAIVQKLLPKLHGPRKKMIPVLEELWELCLYKENKDTLLEQKQSVHSLETICRYPVSAEKIHRMYKNVCDNGFTSFAEA